MYLKNVLLYLCHLFAENIVIVKKTSDMDVNLGN